MEKIELTLPTEQATHDLGALIAKHLQTPSICYLEGDLGVGKTRLVRAIIQSLGHKGTVKSPTYTLVEPYQFTDFTAYHFDLYRLSDPEELDYLGIRDYFDEHSLVFIEWPDKGKGWIAAPDVEIILEFKDSGRTCLLQSHSLVGDKLLKNLKQFL
ncbi:MAG: tRNA (adenosine(37)-N6)-threonylcarbamoyltransferase complex ATPase subunit type 1 TsaE [Gammaproteobacteria bacterium]|nr:MAG: tRNA (adenosine(37)-N6)-threonylcarbamoyltransferase complex ATPase subunit type 1 TsaE [Gammaproteobacteria bacterium]